jgi:hypothetical protein
MRLRYRLRKNLKGNEKGDLRLKQEDRGNGEEVIGGAMGLNLVASVVQFDSDLRARDEQIQALQAQIAALTNENQRYCTSLRAADLSTSSQPGPPLRLLCAMTLPPEKIVIMRPPL